MLKKTVLILDDEREIRDLVRTLLTTQVPDVRFYESSDAIDAYHKFARQTFDLLILDIGLPRHNGYQVLQHLQDMPKPLHPRKILILSGHATEDEIKKHWPASFRLLTKPCKSSVLRSEVVKILDELEAEEASPKVS